MNRAVAISVVVLGLLGGPHIAFGQVSDTTNAPVVPNSNVTLIANDETDKGLATANHIKALMRDHRLDEALAEAQAATQTHPELELSWYSLGDVYTAMQRYQDAIAPFQKCIEMDPKNGPALWELGCCQQQLKQYDASIENLTRAIDRLPNFELVWRALYGSYGGKNDIPGAEKAFRAFTEKYPQSPYSWYTLGQVQMYEQLPNDAIASWEKTVQLKPDFYNGLRNLGLAYAHTQQYDKAIGMFAKAAAVKPDPEIVNDMGYTYMLVGQNDKAIETLKQSLALDPKYPKTLYNLADAYSREKQWSLAWQTAHALEQIDPKSAAQLTKNFAPEDTPSAPLPSPTVATATNTPIAITAPAPAPTSSAPAIVPTSTETLSTSSTLTVAPPPSQPTTVTPSTTPAATPPATAPSPTPAPVNTAITTPPPAPPADSATLTPAQTPTPAPTAPAPAPSSSAPTYTIAPPPAWVTPIDPDSVAASSTTDVEGGIDYLLIDNQQNVEPQGAFKHYTVRLLNEQGLQTGSDLRAEFDPNYQSLTINWLRVKRDGVWSDRLRSDSFQLIRREENLDSQMLDGRYSAVCHLQDVRAGDLVDFAYTVTGANPVFGGKFVSTFATGFLCPVHVFSNSVLIPPGRDITVKGFGGATDPARTSQPDGAQLLTWRQEGVPAATPEPATPAWYDSLPWVELTEFKSWNEVARWGHSAFSLDDPLTPDLQQVVDDIKAAHTLPETRAVAAINFVQDQVRYLGIEMGSNSYRPTPAAQVLAHRFGDCKDKAQLCVVMLHALGIHCDAALVSTTRGEATTDLLPSPLDFDHVIVALNVDNHLYWVDPTRTGQRGQLRDLAVDDFKRALPVSPDSTALAKVVVSPASLPQITVDQTYQVPSATDPSTLLIHAVYRGSAAEGIRNGFSAMARDQLQKDYLDYFGRVYPQIKVGDTMRFQDFPDDNRCEVWQTYTVPGLWKRDSDNAPYIATFIPFSIAGAVGQTTPVPRTAPFLINYPADVTVNMEINLFDEWPLAVLPSHIATPNLEFTFFPKSEENVIHFQYHYQALAPEVAPANLQEYNNAVSRIRDQLEYHLTYVPGMSPNGLNFSRINWDMAKVLGAVFGVTAALCIGFCFIRRSEDDHDPYFYSPYEGIGGWLVAVCIMIGLGLLTYGRITFTDCMIILDQDKWNLLTRQGSPRFDPWWEPLLLLEALSAIVMATLMITAFVLMFLKRFTFPWFMIAVLALNMILNLVEFSLRDKIAQLLQYPLSSLGPFAIAIVCIRSALWITYFLVSKRVKATFRM